MISPPHKTKFDTAYEPDPNAPGDYSVATRNVSLREAFAWVPNSRCCNLNLAPEEIAKEVTKHGCLTEPLCEPFADGVTGFDGNLTLRELIISLYIYKSLATYKNYACKFKRAIRAINTVKNYLF